MKKIDPVVHFEIPGKDTKRMRKFYETVFNWKTQQLGKEMGEYILVTTVEKDEKTSFPKEPGRINGGFYQMTDDPLSQYPSIVIAVEDIKESMKSVQKAGGKISGEIQRIPGTGLLLSIIDTEGNRVSMIQPDPMPMPEKNTSNMTTCLWFDKQAEEAANFYVDVFTKAGHSAKIGKIARYGESSADVSGQAKGSVMTVEFELDGNSFLGLNGGSMFKFSMATSFMVNCKNQKEVDYFWDKLGEGGKYSQCGWIEADKFGVTWQIVPTIMNELMTKGSAAQSERVMKAMISMKKLNIQALKDAYQKK